MAALGGLGYGALLSLPWAVGATRSWRHEPLGTQGMRVRTPSGGMACPGPVRHTQWRSCFPAFPFVKLGGLVLDPAALRGLSSALLAVDHEGQLAGWSVKPFFSGTARRMSAVGLAH